MLSAGAHVMDLVCCIFTECKLIGLSSISPTVITKYLMSCKIDYAMEIVHTN